MRAPFVVAALVAALPACAQPPPAGYAAPQRVTIQGYDGDAMEPFLSRDGRTLFFNTSNEDPRATDLHWAERRDDLTFAYRGPVAAANGPDLDAVASMSAAGRFCFISPRLHAGAIATVHCGEWRDGRLTGVALQPGVSVRRPGRVIFDAEIDARGERLVVADGIIRGGPVPAAPTCARRASWTAPSASSPTTTASSPP